jgi:hypothetical protein
MTAGEAGNPLAVLQRIRTEQGRADAASPAGTEGTADTLERCDLCAEPVPPDHGHLVDLQARNLLCACRGCYLLFTADGSGGLHYRAVPDRYLSLSGPVLSTAHWNSLQIPVGVAFFFFNSSLGRVAAFYPGPAGATESELPLDTWEEVVAANQVLDTVQPDVEAFLVRADASGTVAEAFIVPIDACYELVGHLRRLWKGFDGGREAHRAVDAFFARVRSRVR